MQGNSKCVCGFRCLQDTSMISTESVQIGSIQDTTKSERAEKQGRMDVCMVAVSDENDLK